MRQEITSLYGKQTAQVAVLDCLAGSLPREPFETAKPVDGWRQAIDQQDRSDAEWLRRERVFDRIDELFPEGAAGPNGFPNAGQPGLARLYAAREPSRRGGSSARAFQAGGGGPGRPTRTGNLNNAMSPLVGAQWQWIVDTFGGGGDGDETEAADGRGGPPEEPRRFRTVRAGTCTN